MPTFSVTQEQILEGQFVLKGRDARHISQVLRMTAGETLSLSTDGGRLYEGRVKEIVPELILEVLREIPAPQLPFDVHLHLAFLKKDKLEWVIQKACELNVSSVHFFPSKRAVLGELSDKKTERFGRIVAESMKQCGRLVELKLQIDETFDEDSFLLPGTHLWCDVPLMSKAAVLFSEVVSKSKMPIHLWVGPEGGWSSEEQERAIKAQVSFVTLGPLVLRAETAAIAAMSMVVSQLFEKNKC